VRWLEKGGGVKIPGDPKECRQHALNCMLDAKAAKTLEARDSFTNLARSWIRLAEEFERTQALLAEVNELDEEFEPIERTV
jgi:hypothetical protein